MCYFYKLQPMLLPALLLITLAGNANAVDWFPSIFGSSKSESADDPNVRPAWVDNPGNGVSASAGVHVRGKEAQEELAVIRGRAEFAKRFGVSIAAEQNVSTTVNNGHASTTANQMTHEETNQTDVKAVVKAKWRDPDSEVLWVWLVPSN